MAQLSPRVYAELSPFEVFVLLSRMAQETAEDGGDEGDDEGDDDFEDDYDSTPGYLEAD